MATPPTIATSQPNSSRNVSSRQEAVTDFGASILSDRVEPVAIASPDQPVTTSLRPSASNGLVTVTLALSPAAYQHSPPDCSRAPEQTGLPYCEVIVKRYWVSYRATS